MSYLWYLRKITDSYGRPLFWNYTDSLASKFGKEFFGTEYIVNQSMPATSAGLPQASAQALLYGDMSKIVVRWVKDVRFYTLNELYRANDQVGCVAFARMDSNYLGNGAFGIAANPIQCLAIHS